MNISKQVKLIAALLFSISFLSATDVQAISLVDSGFVNEIRNGYIHLNDQMFQISPTAKVILEDKKIGSIDMIKPQDWVRVKVITINKRDLVDTIWVLQE